MQHRYCMKYSIVHRRQLLGICRSVELRHILATRLSHDAKLVVRSSLEQRLRQKAQTLLAAFLGLVIIAHSIDGPLNQWLASLDHLYYGPLHLSRPTHTDHEILAAFLYSAIVSPGKRAPICALRQRVRHFARTLAHGMSSSKRTAAYQPTKNLAVI